MNRTMTDEEVLRAAVSNLAIDDPTWTMEEARAIMHDSGEHDTLDDQLAHEQERGTREYQAATEAAELARTLIRNTTGDVTSEVAVELRLLYAKLLGLRDSLAPRPTITPAGSIDDVPWADKDTDQ